jgi:hypothetical protein
MIRKIHSLRRSYAGSLACVLSAFGILSLAPASRAQQSVIQIEASKSKIDFTLGATMHTVHGTFALKSGEIRFDASSRKIEGTIVADATSGDTGNLGRDQRMNREILEI